MTKYISIFIFLYTYNCFAQNVNIPDSYFKSLLVNDYNINTNKDSEISLQEAANYTGVLTQSHLGSINNPINDITGIEAFTGVSEINVNFGNVNDTIDLRSCISLKKIIWSYGNLAGINLENHTNIQKINVGGGINFLKLLNNTKLDTLDIGYASIDSLNLDDAVNLKYLSSSEENPALKSLKINNTPNLVSIYVRYSSLSEIDLSSSVALQKVIMQGNKLKSIDVSNNINIVDLWVFGNELTEITFGENTKLSSLFADNNSLTSINLSKLTSLKTLRLSNNNISSLNLGDINNIEYIYIHDNNLSSLDVSNNTQLTQLSSNGNASLSTICVYDIAYAENNEYVKLEDAPEALPFFIKPSSASWASNCKTTSTYSFNNTLTRASFNFYPNPSTKFIIISSNKNISDIIIYDILGEVISFEVSNNNKLIFNNDIKPGVYNLFVSFEDGTVEHELMKVVE